MFAGGADMVLRPIQPEITRDVLESFGANVKYFENPEQPHWPQASAAADIFGHILPGMGLKFNDKSDQDWKKNGHFEAFD